MSTTAQSRTVIVCLPAEGGTEWLAATTAVAAHTDQPPAGQPGPQAEQAPAHREHRSQRRRLLGAVRRHGLVTHVAGGRRHG